MSDEHPAAPPPSAPSRSNALDTPDASSDRRLLEGNGVGLVREIALASRVQKGLENLYRLDRAADVETFLIEAEDGEREALLFRETEEGDLEMSVRVPRLEGGLDPVCQIIEGVSHFVYLADRASRRREATQLELELQAEVDKWVILAASIHGFDEVSSRALRTRLYENVAFAHAEDTIEGERYRVANDYARRFTARLEREYLPRAHYGELRHELFRFFHMGQQQKLQAA